MTGRPWETDLDENPLLEAALESAAKGWRVFPCAPNGKVPLLKTNWQDIATSDPEIIREWWRAHSKANYGIATGEKSGVSVVDVDIKDGRAGEESAIKLGLTLHDTLTIRTASGGWHYYFTHPEGFRNRAGLMSGIDTRGDGGYVVGPGSIIDGDMYDVANVGDIQPMPESVLRITAPVMKTFGQLPDGNAFDLDADEVKRIRAALGHIDADGYETWLTVGMALYELAGGSEQMFALWDWWSASSDKYEAGTMAKRWRGFASDRGDKITEATLWHMARAGGYVDASSGAIFVPDSSVSLAKFKAGLLDRNPGPTEYVIDEIIPKSVLSVLDGDGGIGKSFGGLQKCASIASGSPFLGKFGVFSPGLAVYLTTEDNKIALARRYKSMRESGNYTADDIEVMDERFILIPWGDEKGPALSVVDSRGQVTPTAAYEYLRALLDTASEPIRYMHLDPAVDLHGGEGFKPNEIRQFCNLLKRLINEYDTTICINHHLNKSGAMMGSVDWVNASRNHMRLAASGEGIRLTNEKRNDDAKFLPIILSQKNGLLEFDRRDVERTEAGKFTALKKGKKDEREVIVLEILKAQSEPYTMAAAELKTAVGERLLLGVSAAEKLIKAAHEDPGGLIKRRGGGPATLYYHASYAPFVEPRMPL